MPQPFTKGAAQLGWISIAQFWEDNSSLRLTLDGTEFFGWTTLPMTNGDFQKANPDRHSRIEAAKGFFNIDYSKFTSVIVIFSESAGDAWATDNGAIFDPSIALASYMCHEMAHLFGELNHSFDFSGRILDPPWSKPGEYFDQLDIMSAENCWNTSPDNGVVFSGYGPNFCMMWKDRWNWLDDTNRLSITDYGTIIDETVTLVSRTYQNHMSGFVCVSVADLYVEFATAEGWDAGLPSPGVLIHQDVSMIPYVVVPDVQNNPDQKCWVPGPACRHEVVVAEGRADLYIRVLSINLPAKIAQVQISRKYLPPTSADLRIVAIRKYRSTAGGGDGFDYIEYVGVEDDEGTLQAIVRNDVISWITQGINTFYVLGDDGSRANVIVESHYITTVADNTKADNLLSLPSF